MTDTIDEVAGADAELVASLERIARDLERLPRTILAAAIVLAVLLVAGDVAVVIGT